MTWIWNFHHDNDREEAAKQQETKNRTYLTFSIFHFICIFLEPTTDDDWWSVYSEKREGKMFL